MKNHIFSNIFSKKLRTNTKFNIFILFLICFLTIIVLFLLIDSKRKKLSDLDKITTECLNNHHYHAAVRWNEIPLIGKLFAKQLPALNSVDNCFRLWNILSDIISRQTSEQEKKLQTAAMQLSFMSPVDDAFECELKYEYYRTLWWNNAPLLGTFFKKTVPTYDVELDCFKLMIFDMEEHSKAIDKKIKFFDEMKKIEEMDKTEEKHREELGYDYLHDYQDEHTGDYKLYQ